MHPSSLWYLRRMIVTCLHLRNHLYVADFRREVTTYSRWVTNLNSSLRHLVLADQRPEMNLKLQQSPTLQVLRLRKSLWFILCSGDLILCNFQDWKKASWGFLLNRSWPLIQVPCPLQQLPMDWPRMQWRLLLQSPSISRHLQNQQGKIPQRSNPLTRRTRIQI